MDFAKNRAFTRSSTTSVDATSSHSHSGVSVGCFLNRIVPTGRRRSHQETRAAGLRPSSNVATTAWHSQRVTAISARLCQSSWRPFQLPNPKEWPSLTVLAGPSSTGSHCSPPRSSSSNSAALVGSISVHQFVGMLMTKGERVLVVACVCAWLAVAAVWTLNLAEEGPAP